MKGEAPAEPIALAGTTERIEEPGEVTPPSSADAGRS